MAKILRKNMKIFGSNAGPQQLGVFGSLAAGLPDYSTDPEDIQSLPNYLAGWFGAVLGNNSPAIQDMNALQYVYAYQLAYLMQAGVAEWNAETSYYIGSIVNVAGELFVSIANDNLNQATSDEAYWSPYSTEKPGTLKDYLGATAPRGWVLASGLTIGSAASGATARANADTFALYTLLWTDYSDALLPIFTSAGAGSTRGASAAADFAANKRLSLPDLRGRVTAGKDNMGGSAASRLTATTITPDGNTLGASGGAQTHTLTSGQMPSHTHTQNAHSHALSWLTSIPNVGSYQAGSRYGNGTDQTSSAGNSIANTTPTNQNTGGDGAHNNVQPTFIVNKIIKL